MKDRDPLDLLLPLYDQRSCPRGVSDRDVYGAIRLPLDEGVVDQLEPVVTMLDRGSVEHDRLTSARTSLEKRIRIYRIFQQHLSSTGSALGRALHFSHDLTRPLLVRRESFESQPPLADRECEIALNTGEAPSFRIYFYGRRLVGVTPDLDPEVLAVARLGLAGGAQQVVDEAFRVLGEADPRRALRLLRDGVRVAGGQPAILEPGERLSPEALVGLLEHGDPEIRRGALEALGRLGPNRGRAAR